MMNKISLISLLFESKCALNEDSNNTHVEKKSRLIFLGTGSSTGIPHPSCLFPGNSLHSGELERQCEVSRLAMKYPPEVSKNYRCNPSMLIDFYDSKKKENKYIQIDATKNFKESVVRWYPRHGIPRLDALILTHDHADAMFGLDDVRGVQLRSDPPMPVYLSEHTFATIQTRFPYLVPKDLQVQLVSVPAVPKVKRWVAALDYRVIKNFCPFDACGLKVRPIPVMHGEDYESLGFCIGEQGQVVYISDVSRIPENTMAFLETLDIKVLVIDALKVTAKHPTHFSGSESLEVIRRLKPQRSFFIGMGHDFEHELENSKLKSLKAKEGIDVELSHDGLVVDVDL